MVYTYCENSFSGDTYFNRVKVCCFFLAGSYTPVPGIRYSGVYITSQVPWYIGTVKIVSTVIHIKSSDNKLFLRTPYPNVVQKVSLLFY